MSQRISIIDLIPWAFHGHPDSLPTLKDSVAWEANEFSKLRFKSPFFGLITPMWNTPLRFLEELVESCLAQSFPSWELILVDDGSPNKEHVAVAKKFAQLDSRIKVFDESNNRGISGARNFAISQSSARYLAILDHDDLLHPRILAHFYKVLESDPLSLIFCNEVKIDQHSQKLSQFFYKPEFDRATVLRSNYVAHFAAVSRRSIEGLIQRDGEVFRTQFDGAEDHDYFLRLSSLEGFRSHHTSVFGYLWRKSANSTAENLDAKPYVKERLRKLLAEHSEGGVEIRFPEKKDEKFPAVYSPNKSSPVTDLTVWVWGRDVSQEISALLVKAWPSLKFAVNFSKDLPSRINFIDAQASESTDNWVLILDGNLKISREILESAFVSLSGLAGYSSLGLRVLDKSGADVGDLAIDYEAKGGITVRSQLTGTDFPADQRRARFPMPYFLLARDIPDSYLDRDLNSVLVFIRSRMIASHQDRHFYEGRTPTHTTSANLLPEKINWIYEDMQSQRFKNYLIKTSMVYDPDQRWLHASRLSSDWYEVPRRYQLADDLNLKFKTFTKPVHQLVKKIMK